MADFTNNDKTPIKVFDSRCEDVLKSIQDSIVKSSNNQLDAISDYSKKQSKSERKAAIGSLNAARAEDKHNRAVENVLHANIKKADSLKKVMTDLLGQVLDVAKKYAADSLKSYSNLAAIMRRSNLSASEKKEAGLKADEVFKAVPKLFNYLQLSKDSVNEGMQQLISMGNKQHQMTVEEIAAFSALQKRGIDSQRAFELAKTADTETIKGLVDALSDPNVSGGISSAVNSLNMAQLSLKGGVDKSIAALVDNARQINAGHGMLPADVGLLLTKQHKVNSGLFKDMDDQEINMHVAIQSLSKSKESISKLSLATMNMIPGLERLALAKVMIDKGKSVEQPLRTPEENAAANAENTEKGKISQLSDSLFANINTLTGGAITSVANTIDKYFGESYDIVDITSRGFKIVTTLLSAIVASKIISAPLSILKSVLPTGITGIGAAAAGLGAFTAAAASITIAGEAIYNTHKILSENEEAERAVTDKINKNAEALSNLQTSLEKAQREGNTEQINQIIKQRAILEAEKLELAKEQRDVQYKALNAQQKSGEDWESSTYWPKIRELQTQLERTAASGGNTDDIKKEIDALNEIRAGFKKSNEDSYTNAARELYNHSFISSLFGEWSAETEDEIIENIASDKRWEARKKELFDSLTSAGNSIKSKAGEVISYSSNLYDTITDLISDSISSMYNKITDTVSDIASSIRDKLFGMLDSLVEKVNAFIQPIKNLLSFEWLPSPIKSLMGLSGEDGFSIEDMSSTIADSISSTISKGLSSVGKSFTKMDEFFNKLSFFADGTVANKATAGIIGEAGREAVLPLTRPDKLFSIIKSLSSGDRKTLFSSLLSAGSKDELLTILSQLVLSNINNSSSAKNEVNNKNASNNGLPGWPSSYAPGDDPATINKILSMAGPYANYVFQSLSYGRNKDGSLKSNKAGYGPKKRAEWYQEALVNAADNSGRDLIKGTYAEKALDWAVTQIGKPYILRSLGQIGYVCNELTNAAILSSGFDMGGFRIHSVKQTFKNIAAGKYRTKKDKNGNLVNVPEFRLREDLTPSTALPGMLFFQDSRKNPDGGFQPGHVGLIYYGHKIIHASGGSGDYTKGGFLQAWQTPGRGVTVTPPNPSARYVIGEFPGMFEKADGSSADTSVDALNKQVSELEEAANQVNADASISRLNLLSQKAIQSVIASVSGDEKLVLNQLAAQAASTMSSGNTKDITKHLMLIVNYLREIAGSGKKVTPSPAKPAAAIFG